MIALIQRVTEANVSVDGELVGSIGPGLLALICAERDDTPAQSDALLGKMLGYRIFSDDAGKMNRSLIDTGGSLLLVPQFTLAADTRSGTRPSFSPAAPPEEGKRLFDHFVAQAKVRLATVETGRFGADMQVASVNNGPVTFWLQVRTDGGQGRRI